MQIADFGGFSLHVLPDHTGFGIVLDGVDAREETNFQCELPWEQVQGLINALQHAQQQHAAAIAAQSGGTVAAVLLQSHTAEAPGDFG